MAKYEMAKYEDVIKYVNYNKIRGKCNHRQKQIHGSRQKKYFKTCKRDC